MYKKILVPLDGSELAECVLPHVESIANGCGVEEVVFLRVVEPLRWVVGTPYDVDQTISSDQGNVKLIDSENKDAAERYLNQLVTRTHYNGVTIQSEILMDRAAEGIAEYATKNGFELIIIATHGRSGISRWILGSVADRVLRSACVPVLMIRAPGCIPGT
ncbi:universal stress protein [Chloroflexota bacterium]